MLDELTGSEPPAAPQPPQPPLPPAPEGAGAAPELGPSGFRALRWPGRGEVFVGYREITHVVLEPRGVAVGTLHGVVLLSRAQLGGDAAAERFVAALRERVYALPQGDALRARFERLDAKLGARRPWIAAILVALTVVAFGLQRFVPGFTEAAVYRPGLLAAGEWWRYAATQFLHVGFWHLAMNAISALIAGAFVERALGRAATLFVAGAAGAGAMLASSFGSYGELLGFSGIASGFFGALLAIEFLAPGEAPASARIPRPILVGVVALQAALDLLSPHIASLAHVGGFVAGGVAVLLVREGTRDLVRAGAAAAVIAALASFGMVARNLVDPAAALEREAIAVAKHPVADPGTLNNLAWGVATAKQPSPEALDAAAQLAELAVAMTSRQEPTVLDTLAEVYFAQGRKEDALAAIDEAIALAPGEAYYAEQRRRFTGERAAGDRPEPPPQPQEAPRAAPGPPGGAPQPGNEAPPPGSIDLPPGDEITV